MFDYIEFALGEGDKWIESVSGMPNSAEIQLKICNALAVYGLSQALENRTEMILPNLRKPEVDETKVWAKRNFTISEMLVPALRVRSSHGVGIQYLKIVDNVIPGGDMDAVRQLVDVLEYEENVDEGILCSE